MVPDSRREDESPSFEPSPLRGRDGRALRVRADSTGARGSCFNVRRPPLHARARWKTPPPAAACSTRHLESRTAAPPRELTDEDYWGGDAITEVRNGVSHQDRKHLDVTVTRARSPSSRPRPTSTSRRSAAGRRPGRTCVRGAAVASSSLSSPRVVAIVVVAHRPPPHRRDGLSRRWSWTASSARARGALRGGLGRAASSLLFCVRVRGAARSGGETHGAARSGGETKDGNARTHTQRKQPRWCGRRCASRHTRPTLRRRSS